MKRIFKNRSKQAAAEAGTTVAALGLGTIKIERVHKDAKIPVYANDGDSGMDVYAIADMLIVPGFTGIVKTGLKMEIPNHPLHDAGYRFECQVRPRSGISATTTIRVSNAPGTIDNFYRDEIGIILSNTADKVNLLTGVDYVLDLKGNRIPLADAGMDLADSVPANSYIIRKGDKIAQLVFNEVLRPAAIIEAVVTSKDSRGGGFGHSGINDATNNQLSNNK